jgi:hypothetical protein
MKPKWRQIQDLPWTQGDLEQGGREAQPISPAFLQHLNKEGIFCDLLLSKNPPENLAAVG